jgi:pimeloyl-ACP methyl ester carboxylesterase
MTYRTSLTALALARAGVVAHPAAASATAGPSSTSGVSSVQWKSCPAYSDEVIRSLGVAEEKVAAFRSLMKRLECGTVSVPLNHREPGGREIDIAVTRLAATDAAHRLGAVAVLPGGPGNSGYLDPVLRTALRNEEMAGLNERYDIIGFDPRGVGYSTKVACPLSPHGPQEPGTLTEEAARKIYDAQVAANQKCGRSDPAFLGQLTTENVAKDLDLVRSALGERSLNLLGFSWGTYLGMVYRSLFPGHTGRAFLDSVAPPWTRVDEHAKGSAEAAERNFGRMAAWLARRDGAYGLGATARQVREEVTKLVRAYDKSPKIYTDLQRPIDGSAVADLARRNSTEWTRAGKALAELRTAAGTTAPPAVKELLGAPMMGTPLPARPNP